MSGTNRRVGLLFGGRSVEHEVSLTSARGVAAALRGTELDLVPIGVSGSGRWLSPEVSARVLSGSCRRVEPTGDLDDGCRVVLEPGAGRLECLGLDRSSRAIEVDVVFPLIHGWGGEDGRLQGALELVGVPYVGAGVLGSAAGMNKVFARRMFEAHGLPGVSWLSFVRADYEREGRAIRNRITSELGFPAFVKPANGGSSVGVNRVEGEARLSPAIEEALACDHEVLVERGVPTPREIECAILGNDDPEASVLGEIVPSGEFYDYSAKYLDGTSRLILPAELAPDLGRTIRDVALRAFRCLGLAGLARVDFLIDGQSGGIYLNEVNTLPGFTPISMFPRLWEASGLPYDRLLVRLVDLAQERWRRDRVIRTQWSDAG